jgi:hypothetical protein
MVKDADCITIDKQFPAGNESTTMEVILPDTSQPLVINHPLTQDHLLDESLVFTD